MTTPDAPLRKFRWPVAVSRTIAAPTSKIWEVISSPGTLPLYHPFCKKNPVFEWSGANSHDEVHYFNGVVLTRRFSDWYEDVGYDLEIGRAGGRTSALSKSRSFRTRSSTSRLLSAGCPTSSGSVPSSRATCSRWSEVSIGSSPRASRCGETSSGRTGGSRPRCRTADPGHAHRQPQ